MLISILTPTYNRTNFLKLLAIMIYKQSFDLKDVEWILVDDSVTNEQVYFSNHPLNKLLHKIQYVHLSKKQTIGYKRNLCKLLAMGDILIHMDDDDYYHCNYVQLIAYIFSKTSEEVVGASEIAMIAKDSVCLYKLGPYIKNHSCGGILSYRREYALQNNYNSERRFGEERDFLKGYHTPLFQIPSAMKYNLVLSHRSNTVKKEVEKKGTTNFIWIDFVVQDVDLIMAYLDLYAEHLQDLLQHRRKKLLDILRTALQTYQIE